MLALRHRLLELALHLADGMLPLLEPHLRQVRVQPAPSVLVQVLEPVQLRVPARV